MKAAASKLLICARLAYMCEQQVLISKLRKRMVGQP